jgi:hypothetical protein
MYGPSETLEQFFVDVLGLDVATATHEADQLARVLDDDTLERLEGFVEFVRMRGIGAIWADRRNGFGAPHDRGNSRRDGDEGGYDYF